MDQRCAEAIENQVIVSSAAPRERPLCSACGVMRATYYANAAALEEEACGDVVEIVLIPDHPVFYAAYHCSAQREHLAHKVLSHCAERVELLVIAIDRVYFERTARVVLNDYVPHITDDYRAADSFLRELGSMLIRDFRERLMPTSAYLESLAAVLALHLATHHSECRAMPSQPAGLPRHKLKRVLAFIDQHLGEPIHIRDLASMTHISLHHFARMFKHATGVPPHLYITLQRVERAKSLLRNSDLPLVDVAASIGFQTQGHFTAVFHRYVQTTPRVFRLSSRRSARECGERRTGARRIQSWMSKEMQEQACAVR